MLEYYHGMLFITTNRLKDFDGAFRNHIHLTISYDPLDIQARKNIWRQHLSKATKNDKTPNMWTDEMYSTLAELRPTVEISGILKELHWVMLELHDQT
jgi:hypothetical protein